MAYLEVKKDGKVVERLRITLGDAGSTCPVRIGNSEMHIALGEVKQVGEYEVALVDIPTADAVDEQDQEDLSAELASMVTSGRSEPDMLLPSEDQRVSVMHGPRDAQESDAGAVSDSVELLLRDSDEPRYAERETIGKGGMGEIILCVERNTRRQVAMKRMLPTAAKLPRSRARFVEEAQVTAQLEHPNIVPVHELEMADDGAIYFTMKLVKGRSLAEILKAARDNEESPSLGELLQIFLKVCDGVAFAHSRGVIHRDLKPANIMVGNFGEVLVMDWGVAKILGHEEVEGQDVVRSTRQELNQPEMHTIAGRAMGSPTYMSPEQAAGDLDRIGPSSDVYSLGAILYEMLTLKRPVTGDTAKAVLAKVTRGQITPPEQRAPERNIPRELSAVAMKCLSKSRHQRYQSATGLQHDVNLYLAGRSVSADPDTFAQAFVKLLKRNKALSAAVTVAAVIVITVVSVAFVRTTRAMRRAIDDRQAAQEARDKQHATALAASRRFAMQAIRAAETGRMDEAERRVKDAEAVVPDSPWGFYARGMFARTANDYAAAADLFRKALKADPNHAESKAALSEVLATTGDLAEAKKLLAGAGEATDWRALMRVARTLYDAGRWEDCQVVLKRAVTLMKKQKDATPGRMATAAKEVQAMIDKAQWGIDAARAKAACEGFAHKIRNLAPREQVQLVKDKLSEVNGVEVQINKVEIEGGEWVRAHLPRTIRFLDPLRGVPLRRLNIKDALVRNLSPLKGMPLTYLDCGYTGAGSLSPLKGMPLTYLDCGYTRVSDLSPLKGMPLRELAAHRTRIADLSPLKGMRLERLVVWDTKVSDLGVLKDMPLRHLDCAGTPVRDLSPLKGMPLEELNISSTQVTDLGPVKEMPLTKLGCARLKISDLSVLEGVRLTSLNCHNTNITDLRPLKGMLLTQLNCSVTPVKDLTPLKGMPLTELDCASTRVKDLTPLKGMPLTSLTFHATRVADLSPLKGMPLTYLKCGSAPISDLGPLRGMQLTFLWVDHTDISDISPLKGMPLVELNCFATPVSDISPLKGMELKGLWLGSKVTDLTPLAGMELDKLIFKPKNITKGIEIVREMKSIRQIGHIWAEYMTPEEFWKKYDAGEFNK